MMARRDLLLPRLRSRAAWVAAMAARRQRLGGDEKDHVGEGECRGVPLESITRRPPAPVSAVEGCTGRGSDYFFSLRRRSVHYFFALNVLMYVSTLDHVSALVSPSPLRIF